MLLRGLKALVHGGLAVWVTGVVDDVGGDGDATAGNYRHLRDLCVDGGLATYGETCADPSTEYVTVSVP